MQEDTLATGETLANRFFANGCHLAAPKRGLTRSHFMPLAPVKKKQTRLPVVLRFLLEVSRGADNH